MTTTIRSIFCALLLGLVTPAFAAEGDYTIEVVIFAQNNYGAGAQPYNPYAADPEPPATAGARYIGRADGMPYSQLESMPGSQFVLSDDAARLRREGYEILWHGGWFQHVSTGQNPAVRVATQDGRIDGVIKVDRSRYLHFKPDLLLSRSASAESASTQYRLKQSRRMRSKELHYLDHPLFGILVYIKPIGS